MIALIDADLVAYRTAAGYEGKPLENAVYGTDELVNRLIQETGASEARLFLSGEGNFRYKYNPQYKANRKDMPRPAHLQPLREHLVVAWGARVSEGCEADDMMGIAQCEAKKKALDIIKTEKRFPTEVDDTVIVSLDKDMLCIPGSHYSWEISGPLKDGNRWIKEAKWQQVSDVEALRFFYGQLLLGDKSDNIFGFDGLARAKVPKKMEWMFERLSYLDTNLEMFEFVREQYQHFDNMSAIKRLYINGVCLNIQTYEGEIWETPNRENLIQDDGQQADSMDSLSQP